MAQVYLEGPISKFGTSFPSENSSSIADVIKLISCQIPGFKDHLIEASEKDIGFSIQHGKDFLGEEDLLLNLTKEDVIITEVPAGSKGGAGKILAAAAILAVAFFAAPLLAGGATLSGVLTGAAGATAQAVGFSVVGLATNLALTGLSQLLAPGPETDSRESNEASMFNGPVNTVQQGVPVPIAYGELIVGGVPISISYSSTPFVSSVGSFSPYFNLEDFDFLNDIDFSQLIFGYNRTGPIAAGSYSGPGFTLNDMSSWEFSR